MKKLTANIAKLVFSLFALGMLGAASTNAANILIVTDNTGNEANYISFLQSTAGGSHTVTASNTFSGSLSAGQITTLESYDLVIVSRNTNSTNYNQPNQWNALNVPLLLHSAALSRNSRWSWFNADWNATTEDAQQLDISNSSHPIFDGVTTTGDVVSFLGTSLQLRISPTFRAYLMVAPRSLQRIVDFTSHFPMGLSIQLQ
ncbi:MAG: hypothetical protein ACFCU3_06875 [Verrucomicrobiales bacterium]